MFRPIALIALVLVTGCNQPAPQPLPAVDVVAVVKEAVAKKDLDAAARAIEAERGSRGITPPVIEAQSLLAVARFGAKDLDGAQVQARSTYDAASAALAGLKREGKPENAQIAIALGRAIEVLGNVGVERGARSESLMFLNGELATHRGSGVEKRIQKNINLLSLEGTPAPPLDLSESLGPQQLSPLTSLKGKVVFLFFWAHWCPDCKAQAPILAKLIQKYEPRGLAVVAPTQRFGYVAGGAAAAPAVENPYIESVRAEYYPMLAGRQIPLSEANHRRYGVSSTPTLVLVDRQGLIRLYRPGKMTEEELSPIIERLVSES